MRVKIFMKFFIAIQVSHPPFFSLLKIRKTYNFFLVLIRRLIKLSKKFENVRRYIFFVKEIDEKKKKILFIQIQRNNFYVLYVETRRSHESEFQEENLIQSFFPCPASMLPKTGVKSFRYSSGE